MGTLDLALKRQVAVVELRTEVDERHKEVAVLERLAMSGATEITAAQRAEIRARLQEIRPDIRELKRLSPSEEA